jgi:hypothetical protein
MGKETIIGDMGYLVLLPDYCNRRAGEARKGTTTRLIDPGSNSADHIKICSRTTKLALFFFTFIPP